MKRVIALAASALVVLVATPASADHSWSTYHWARKANPFTLTLVDNVSGTWDDHLVTTSADWSLSSVLDTSIVQGTQNPRRCRATSGRIEVCNARYGFNGWLGLAQIWLSRGHIVQGVVKVNDTYFDAAAYDDPNARLHVMCQEVGHTFGLNHQTGASCMDDVNGLFDPSYTRPNQHDYEQLETIYAHLDSRSTVGGGMAAARTVRTHTDARGRLVVTFIYWAR
ncbi:MAG: hypothetical protein HY658_04660 [Actinobacteria bacterium]|nr:hypothetical protein [Actinomycetota bacterium]